MRADYAKGIYKEYEIVLSQKEKLEADYKILRMEYQLMQGSPAVKREGSRAAGRVCQTGSRKRCTEPRKPASYSHA